MTLPRTVEVVGLAGVDVCLLVKLRAAAGRQHEARLFLSGAVARCASDWWTLCYRAAALLHPRVHHSCCQGKIVVADIELQVNFEFRKTTSQTLALKSENSSPETTEMSSSERRKTSVR